ncbi:MAG TPA: GNAT family N-acetyltransferase [Actinomycetes bacterium]|nr:GNAT family N-acetyltransferase [Actinomycetes bacterium]
MNRGPATEITIQRLDGSDPAVAAWVTVQEACRLSDEPDPARPSAARVRGDLEHPWPGTRVEHWLARHGEHTVGVLALGFPQTDNTDVTVIRELSVHTDHRRRGIGAKLWRHAVDQSRGCRALPAACRDDPAAAPAASPGEQLVTAMGARPVREETHGWQEDTLVLPAHRGHRLGLRIKIDNLLQVRTYEPALRLVDTWNADANSHLIAINEALGYRPVSRHSEWELQLEGER